MKIKLKSTLYFEFCFVSKLIFDLEMAIEIRRVHKRFIRLPITLLLCALKFFDLNFLFIEKVQAFLDLILSRRL